MKPKTDRRHWVVSDPNIGKTIAYLRQGDESGEWVLLPPKCATGGRCSLTLDPSTAKSIFPELFKPLQYTATVEIKR